MVQKKSFVVLSIAVVAENAHIQGFRRTRKEIESLLVYCVF